jgi:hypothetical protein
MGEEGSPRAREREAEKHTEERERKWGERRNVWAQ